VPVQMLAGGALAFRAPPARFDQMDVHLLPLLHAALGGAALAAGFPPVMADMGIRWLIVRLDTAAACLAVKPNATALGALMRHTAGNGIAMYGAHPAGGPAHFDVRAFMLENGNLLEDPVTGSANACIARLQQGHDYRARQGTALGRDGRISVTFDDGTPWIGGPVVTVIDGTLRC